MRIPAVFGRRVIAAAALGAIIVGATACGTTSPRSSAPAASAKPTRNPLAGLTADQIVSKATADLKAAASVHVAGPVTDSGQTYVLNLTLGRKGCTGTFALHGKGSVVILQIGKALWLRPDKRFWRTYGGGDPSVLAFLSGKYLRTSRKSALGALAALCHPSALAGLFGGAANAQGEPKTKITVIAGQPALQMIDTGDPDSVYVTISAKPEFLRIDAGSQGHLDFTRYNAPLTLTPPPARQTIDGSTYGF